jgi:Flp pilus assembly protein CpaB
MRTTIRRRNTIVALALAATATILTLYVAKARGRGETPTAAAATVATVYVATREIAAGTPAASLLPGGLIEARTLPPKSVQPGAVTTPAALGGLVAATTIGEGEQLTARSFTQPEALGVLGRIRGSARALQLAGDANQLLAGTLKDGDRVDVLAGLRPGEDSRSAVTKIVLRNLLVLKAPSSSDGGGSATLAVTLQVSDVQVQKLFYVAKNADWTLILRPVLGPYDDSEATATAASVLAGAAR